MILPLNPHESLARSADARNGNGGLSQKQTNRSLVGKHDP